MSFLIALGFALLLYWFAGAWMTFFMMLAGWDVDLAWSVFVAWPKYLWGGR